MGENAFQNSDHNKYSKIYTEHLKFNNKKTKNPTSKMGKTTDTSPRKDIQNAINHMKESAQHLGY